MSFSRAQLQSLSLWDLAIIEWRTRWLSEARPKQIIDFTKEKFDTVFLHPGRGFGKTLALGQWIAWELCNDANTFGHFIGPTHNDVRYVAFEGDSGILRKVPECLIKNYNKTDQIIEFYNNSVLRGFSAEEPERLRGPQCKYLACDEVAAWIEDRATWEQAKFGHRLGRRSTCVIASTPKPKPLIKEFFADKSIKKIGGNMDENKENLSPNFIRQMEILKGSRLGRQELAGELLDQEELGVIKRSQWKVWKVGEPLPEFEIIILSLDTAMSEDNVDVKRNKSDYTACSVWGAWRDPPDKLGKRVPNIILLDAWQERLGFPELVDRVKKAKEKTYGQDIIHPQIVPLFGSSRMFGQGRKADLILIEDMNSGKSLRQQLRREGVPVIPYNPGRADKLTRLNIASVLFPPGYVWAPQSHVKPNEFMTWAEPLISQMCAYSGENSLEHDDLMDSATQALIWLQRNWLQINVQSTYQTAKPKRTNPYAV